MGADFFDDDLTKTDDSWQGDEDESHGIPVRPISDASISRMVRQKEEMANQVSGAVKQIERLRIKQVELEKEKGQIEELTRKQDEYERSKTDIMKKLEQGIILIQKEEVQARRMLELLSETLTRFKNSLEELREIEEQAWSDENFHVELNRAMVRVDIARTDYQKALARIDAMSWHKAAAGRKQSDLINEVSRELSKEKSFGFWVKVGFAMTLPLGILVLVLVAAYIVLALSRCL
jgi:hypothetical protein